MPDPQSGYRSGPAWHPQWTGAGAVQRSRLARILWSGGPFSQFAAKNKRLKDHSAASMGGTVDMSDATREQLLTRLRAYRTDLESRIAFLESNEAEIRFKHEGEWVEATPTVLAGLYRQYGDLGALISDIAAGRP
jgi:hypothetical protein